MQSEAQVLGPVVIVVTVDVVNLASFWDVLSVLHHPDNTVLEVQIPIDLHTAVVPFGRYLPALTSSGGLPADKYTVLSVEDE
ncbi:hypothetical protein NCCP691_17510 [Noviherbaspirillum aridicola]|uniref:Uncharacterized protein n=1 Tax=Noviherbaspirillum aridicola TaxID=2849687 RepID=A0ABQ4Q3W2_9BURK|nr:hypothetical protein NCCP691_17510 [Noviherbaspirillum aridicola]